MQLEIKKKKKKENKIIIAFKKIKELVTLDI